MSKFSLNVFQECLLTVNGCSVSVNMPEAAKDSDVARGLPPYHRRQAFLVDEYPACPPEWLRSSGRIKSYFVPIVEGHGLWLDFNKCLANVPQHVAVVVSVQGINAITGLPCKDAQLEQYRDQCPTHKKDFGPDRFCADCGHKWPKQNYLASPGTPPGQFWLDGFRATDGVIRQYVLTAQQSRGVANALIGGDRVHALGLSFFLSKETRPVPVTALRSNHLMDSSYLSSSVDYAATFDATLNDSVDASMTMSSGPAGADGPSVSKPSVLHACNLISTDWMEPDREQVRERDIAITSDVRGITSLSEPVITKKLEIAAGARIDQRVYDDPNNLEDWQKEPEGLIVINYCQEAEAERILAAGKVDLAGSPEGFLKNVPVGNPA